MLLILSLLITTMRTTAVDMTDSPTARIVCTNSKICTDVDMAIWMAKRRSLRLYLLSNFQYDYRSRYLDDEFCGNAKDAGFLLDEEALDWPIACVWMGGEEESGVCSPAPPAEVFGYIGQQQWQERLVKIRTEVGCPKEAVDAARQVAELYFCRDRCVQAGIGSLASFIMMVATVLTIICVFCAHH